LLSAHDPFVCLRCISESRNLGARTFNNVAKGRLQDRVGVCLISNKSNPVQSGVFQVGECAIDFGVSLIWTRLQVYLVARNRNGPFLETALSFDASGFLRRLANPSAGGW
jgi:hypothetical protein